MDYKTIIRQVPHWPKKGINFIDLTTLWKDKDGFINSIDELYKKYKGLMIDKIVAAESRGFIIGAPLAYLMKAGFVPVRKKGKLPAESISEEYELEYGTDSLAIHKDAISKGDKVLIVDDLIATGGTINAITKLIRRLGGEPIEACFLVELTFLKGKEKVDIPIHSLIKYDSEW